jgi:hypothetical protein
VGLDTISAGDNFSRGNTAQGIADSVSAGATAGMLIAPEAAPALVPAWILSKIAIPHAKGTAYGLCMTGTL